MFCSRCNAELLEDAYFCPKCGYRTLAGKEAGVAMPVDELRETMRNVGLQIEKAFRIAADQMQEAFKTVKENIHQSTGTTSITCASCGQKNSNDSAYCCSCGKKLK